MHSLNVPPAEHTIRVRLIFVRRTASSFFLFTCFVQNILFRARIFQFSKTASASHFRVSASFCLFYHFVYSNESQCHLKSILQYNIRSKDDPTHLQARERESEMAGDSQHQTEISEGLETRFVICIYQKFIFYTVYCININALSEQRKSI